MQEEDKCKLWICSETKTLFHIKKQLIGDTASEINGGRGGTTNRKPSIYITTLSVYIWTGAFGRIYLSFGLGLTMPSNGRMVYF